MNIPDIIEPITRHEEWLFNRMAGRFEGWAIQSERGSLDVPLNSLDYFAIRVLAKTIEAKTRTTLAIPRLTPGISLSLASYLTVNRFIVKERSGLDALALMFEGFHAIQLDNRSPIVVITKDRKLRDYYLTSSLTFSGHSFSFKEFPLFRINRVGRLVPLLKNQPASKKIPPVIFYHLDQLERIPSELKTAAVIVELDGVNSGNTFKRLGDFLDFVEPSGVLTVTNTFATTAITRLSQMGFETIALRPELVLKHSGDAEGFPSFSSALANIPALTEVHIHPLDSPEIDIITERINARLNKISQTLNSDLPPVFFSARTMFALLKNLNVPLQSLEVARKKSGYTKSIKYLLDRIFSNAYIDMSPSQEAVILPVWSAIGNDYYQLYDLLLSSNPKYDALKLRFSSSSPPVDETLVFYDSFQPTIFKDELLKDGVPEDIVSEIQTESLKNIGRRGVKTDILVSGGLWQLKDDAYLLGSMPEDIHIYCYNSEINSVKAAINRLQELPSTQNTVSTLRKIGFSSEEFSDAKVGVWIIPDTESAEYIDNYHANKVGNEVEPQEDILPDSYIYDDEEFETVLESDPEDEESTYFILETSEGDEYKLSASKDILVYSENSNTVKSINPSDLVEGDSLLAIDGENNREIFQELAIRTRDISGANQKLINQWDDVLLSLRKIREESGDSVYLSMFKMLKCDKTDFTIRQWAKGVTLAPKDEQDVSLILKITGISSADNLAPDVCKEIDKIRNFHRRLGKRIHSKMSEIARGDSEITKDVLDIEIDELLDLTNLVTISKIEGPVAGSVAKKELLVLR